MTNYMYGDRAPSNETFVTLSTSTKLDNERVLTGTANQITVTDGGAGSTVTLSLPQSIHTDADVTFDSLILDDLTATRLVASDGDTKLVSTDLASWVTGTANQITVGDDGDGTITLSLEQSIHTDADLEVDSITLDDLTASLLVASDASKTLSLPQNIHTSATPTFNGLTLDGTGTEALLVRKDSDGGDVFVIDTQNVRVGIGGTPLNPMHIQVNTEDICRFQRSDSNTGVYFRFDNAEQSWKTGLRSGTTRQFLIRDETNSKNIFQLEPGAPAASFYIKSDGNVGLQTSNPTGGQLHVVQSSSTGAKPALFLDQVDQSEQCIIFSSEAQDRDINLFTVNVTGTPKCYWDESESAFGWSTQLKSDDGGIVIAVPTAVVGTGTISSSGTAVTGSGTSFTTELSVGDTIIAGGTNIDVASITDDTHLTTAYAFDPALSGESFTIAKPIIRSSQFGITSIGNMWLASNFCPTADFHIKENSAHGTNIEIENQYVTDSSAPAHIVFTRTAIAGGTQEAKVGVDDTSRDFFVEVNGSDRLNIDTAGTATFQGKNIIDISDTEALLVRKDSDGGDVLIVDTTNSRLGVNITPVAPFHVFANQDDIAKFERDDNNTAVLFRFQNADQIWKFGNRVTSNNFLIRDETNSKNIFQIEPAAPAASFYIDSTGNIGINSSNPTGGQLHVDQSASDGAKPVLYLDQADIDVEFIKFVGSSEDGQADRSLVDAADLDVAGSLIGWIQVYIEDVQATNPITDGVYYIPFYDTPTAS